MLVCFMISLAMTVRMLILIMPCHYSTLFSCQCYKNAMMVVMHRWYAITWYCHVLYAITVHLSSSIFCSCNRMLHAHCCIHVHDDGEGIKMT